MGRHRRKHHQWQQRKKYGSDKHFWLWYYQRPFSEPNIALSQGSVSESNVLEIYFHVKRTEYLDTRATERKIGRALQALFGVGKYICTVAQQLPLITVDFHTRINELPESEKMEMVPEVIESSTVEAWIDRWDYKTGEYQGRYYLSDFDMSQRCKIKKFCDGAYKDKQVLGSIWAFARA